MIAILLLACSPDFGSAPAAEVVESGPAALAPSYTQTLAVDADTSRIEFVAAKVTRTHTGGFRKFEGTLTLAGTRPTSVTFTIDMTSLWSDAEKLTRHLLNEDFFFVERHPRATFESREIRPAGGSWTVRGVLGLRGVQREIRFPAAIDVTAAEAHARAEFTIDRQLWAIRYPGKPDDLIKDDVLVRLDLRFPRS